MPGAPALPPQCAGEVLQAAGRKVLDASLSRAGARPAGARPAVGQRALPPAGFPGVPCTLLGVPRSPCPAPPSSWAQVLLPSAHPTLAPCPARASPAGLRRNDARWRCPRVREGPGRSAGAGGVCGRNPAPRAQVPPRARAGTTPLQAPPRPKPCTPPGPLVSVRASPAQASASPPHPPAASEPLAPPPRPSHPQAPAPASLPSALLRRLCPRSRPRSSRPPRSRRVPLRPPAPDTPRPCAPCSLVPARAPAPAGALACRRPLGAPALRRRPGARGRRAPHLRRRLAMGRPGPRAS